MWIHINFWFKRKNAQHRKTYYLNSKQYKEFIDILKEILKPKWLYKRKFFLFEPTPHCFLAIETNYIFSFLISKKLYNIKLPNFISGYDIILNTNDLANGKHFLNILNVFTDYTLEGNINPFPPWLKKFPQRYKATIHMIHCMMNQLTNSRPKELKFYSWMYWLYKGLKKSEKNTRNRSRRFGRK